MTNNNKNILSLKYRPSTFKDLIGQEVMVETITNSIKMNKIPNAYLLTGIRGVGKTTTARIIAKALNCKKGIDNLCKDKLCEHCETITNSSHMDVLEMDAASKTGVDDVRDLIEFSKYAPTTAKYKIFILDECHMISKAGMNALLKTLEEPPSYLRFVFSTTEVRKIPATIISRCQRFDLKRVNSKELLGFLKKTVELENGKISESALKLIVKMSEGSVRDSLSLLERALIKQKIIKEELSLEKAQKIFGHFDKSQLINLVKLVFEGDEKNTIESFRKISDQGVEPKVFLNDFLEILYYIKTFKTFGNNEINFDLSQNEINEIEIISKRIENQTLIMFWQFTLNALEELNVVSNQNLLIEMFLIRIISLKEIPNLEDLMSSDISQDSYEKPKGLKSININNEKNKEKILKTKSQSFEQIKNVIQEKKENILKVDSSESLNIKNFQDLINICSKEKESKLRYDLENNVRLVKFVDQNIEIEFSQNLDKDFIKNLSAKLYFWTGKRWIISLSKEKGEPTYQETKFNLKEKEFNDTKKTKVYEKILKNFPDAELISIEENKNE